MRRLVPHLLGLGLFLGVGLGGYFTRSIWLPWFSQPPVAEETTPAKVTAANETVFLTEQAQKNLKLVTKPFTPQVYWRSLSIPGTVIDRPGHSDRGVVAPVTGVVTRIHRFAGEIVKPGEVLFTFKLLSETLQLAQTELYKASQEIKLNLEQKKRLSLSGAVPEARLIEIDNQLSRLNVTVKAYRQELQNRGLSPEQIEGVMEGKFVSEISVEVPSVHERNLKEPSRKVPSQDEHDGFFEIQELRVEVGQQVEAGHKLMLLANHQLLAFEGRAFQPELPQIERAIRERWPIEIESPEVASSDWPPFERNLSIRYLANTVDPVSRTFAFTIPFDNPYRTLERDGRTVMFWRFRPGQRVKLSIRIEKLDDVIVLPREAVVREGAEVYVFRQNGDSFSRKPVHLLYEEADRMILANDFSIPPGVFVAQNGAPQMNRMLKAQSSSLPKGFHIHADGSVHMGDH